MTLTLARLKQLKEHEIFARGIITHEGKDLEWVAVRGTIHDWAIYRQNPFTLQNYPYGDKVYDRRLIQTLVPCDQEALDMYRD